MRNLDKANSGFESSDGGVRNLDKGNSGFESTDGGLRIYIKVTMGQKLGHGGQNGRLSIIIFLLCLISGKPDS